MALPVTISSVDVVPGASGHARPFRSSSGNIYVLLQDVGTDSASYDVTQDGDFLHIANQVNAGGTAGGPTPAMYKATDPTASFSEVDAAGAATWTHSASDAEVGYARFNMADDTWDATNVLVDDVSDPEAVYAVSISIRSDGDLLIVYQGHRDKFMGVDRARVAYAWSDDNFATWTADQDVSTTGEAVDKYVGAIVIPANNSDQAHIFYNRDDGTPTLTQRALAGDETLRTERDTGFLLDGTNAHEVRSAMAFTRGGSDFVKVVYESATDDITVYEMTPFSDDTDPTSTDSEDDVVAEDPGVVGATPQIDFVFDAGAETIHSLHVDATGDDIQHHDDQGTDTWQDNGTVVTGTITGGGPYCNIYDRDGAKIGYVYQDSSGNVIYNEIDVGAAATGNLSDLDMGEQNSYHGPFDVGSDFYTVGLVNAHDIVMAKATPASPVDADWDGQDGAVRVTVGGRATGQAQDPVESIWAFEDSSDLFIATQQRSGLLSYHVFDPGTDTWTTRNEGVAFPGATNFGDNSPTYPACSLARRSDGDIVLAGAYSEGVIGVQRIRAFTLEAGTWTNRGAIGGTRDQSKSGCVAIGPDSSDRITFVYNGFLNVSQPEALALSRFDGIGGTNEERAQEFVLDADATIDTIKVTLAKTGTPTDNAEIGIQGDSSGLPDDTYIVNGSIGGGSLTTVGVEYTFNITATALTAGTVYHLVARRSGARDSTNFFRISDGNANIYADGSRETKDSGTWSNNTVDLAFTLEGAGSITLATIDSSNTITSAVEVDDVADDSPLLVAPGVIDSANKIYAPYIDADDQISVADWTSGASPTVSVDASIGDNTVYGHGRTTAPFVVACLAVDGTNVHLAYSQNSDQDVYHDDDVEGGGATDSEIINTVTANRISCRVIGTDLAVLYDDGGTTKFHLEDLAAGVARAPGRLSLLGVGHGADR